MIGSCRYCQKEFQKREKKYKFCSVVCSNRNNLNGLRRVIIPDHCKELAEFIGICLGDGYVSKYQVTITLNRIADKDYVLYVTALISKLFPEIKLSMIRSKKENKIEVRINSKIVSSYLQGVGIIPNNKLIPKWIFNSKVYVQACIKGLVDTEGSISFKLYTSRNGISLYKQLNFRNTNSMLMKFVRDNLTSFGFRPTATLKKSLYLSTHEGINRYRDLIGFGNPKLYKRSLVYKVTEYNGLRKI